MPSNEPDQALRQALEPAPESVARTVAAALVPSRRRRPGPWLALAALAAGLLAAVLLPRSEPPPSALGAPTLERSGTVLTNRQGPVTLESPSGPVLVILSGGER